MKYALAAFPVLLAAGCGNGPQEPAPPAATLRAYPTIASMREQLGAGAMTSEAIVTELIARARANQDLNAFITLDADGALAAARVVDAQRASGAELGPLAGIPFVVKDNIHVAGLPNTAGTPGLGSFVPGESNPVVQALVGAGAIVLGKTNLHELAFGITSDNAAYGPVGNPWNRSLFAGGSSGGTAAAIAAGLAPVGLGSDTGGSVRIPAALTGITGFRPTSGRYPAGAVTPISTTRDTVGPMGRRVADLALFDAVITGDDAELATLGTSEIRLGIDRDYYYAGLDDELAATFDGALQQLEDAGVTLVDVRIEGLADAVAATGFPIVFYEAVRDLGGYLAEFETGIDLAGLAAAASSPDVVGVFGLIVGDNPVDAAAYEVALEAREAMRATFAGVFEANELDALVFPTTPLPARTIEGSLETVELNGEQVPTFPTYIRNTDPASIAALPAVSLPAGTTASGLPVGLELDGPEGSDRRLLAVAALVETVLGIGDTPSQND